jgi:catechol 2,3-dioxygenase-like lactoylglutathione lyase family enzyme
MFSRAGSVSLFVSNQDRAKDFYTRIPGFELRQDAPLYPGAAIRKAIN